MLPSDGREAHGQQVLSYTQNIKSTNVSKYVQNSHISPNVHFLPSNTHVEHEAYPPVFPLTPFLSAHNNRFVCVPCLCSICCMAHRLSCVFPLAMVTGGKADSSNGWQHKQVKRDRVPRVGAGSMKRSNWWGVVVGLEDIEGILM